MSRRITEFSSTRPLLVYDGECEFCEYCVEYAKDVTQDQVVYVHYQRVASHYPDIPPDRFESSIQLITPERLVFEGAEAAFRLLAMDPDKGLLLWLYRWLPGFAWICEKLYSWVAKHRALAYRICRLVFGIQLKPSEYQRVTRFFVKCLALIYLVAFLSFGVQVCGLIGIEGILPAAEYFAAIDLAGAERYWRVPSLFWLSTADWFLLAIPVVGVVISLYLFTITLPRLCLFLLFVLYLSLLHAGQIFMRYQWDLLLLETGFMAFWLLCFPRLGIFLMRWLLFRFMWMSGLVKLVSGDELWSNLNALAVHFETQPLPTLFAWYAHQLPDFMLRAMTAATLLVEITIPFLIFAPRKIRLVAFFCFILMQLGILITGNFNFFNLLTLALCLFLLDDRRLTGWLPKRWAEESEYVALPKGVGKIRALAGSLLLGFVMSVSLIQLYLVAGGERRPEWALQLVRLTEPFHLVNPYGVFAVMTPQRYEIIIEGSINGVDWEPYRFWFKPDRLQAMPRWASPYQPRLDWELWFAALRNKPPPWFENMMAGLLLDSKSIQRLFREVPFNGDPPQFVRAYLYRYAFTSFDERRELNNWWKRRLVREYMASMRIVGQSESAAGLMEIPDVR